MTIEVKKTIVFKFNDNSGGQVTLTNLEQDVLKAFLKHGELIPAIKWFRENVLRSHIARVGDHFFGLREAKDAVDEFRHYLQQCGELPK